MGATKKIVSRAPEVMSGELVFAGTRVEVKTLVDYLKVDHTLDDFLEGFQPRAGRGLPGDDLTGHPERSPGNSGPAVGEAPARRKALPEGL